MAKSPKKLPVAGASNPSMGIEMTTKQSPDDEARERKYRAERALEDIERAEKHKGDRDLMRDVKVCAREKIKAYKKL